MVAARRVFLACIFLAAAPCMRAAPPEPKMFQAPPPVSLRELASGLAAPVGIANAGDGSGRLFVVEQGGRIRIVRNGMVLATPFLDLSASTIGGGERGLLGLAFHPQYRTNGRFFVFYTQAADGALRVSTFQVSATNPDVADPASELEVITIAHPASNHNGGQLAFGPDGYLYVGTGDGGGAGDPFHNGQNLATLLGKVLRLDVSGVGGYTIPATNPTFAGVPGARREIWHYGLRNPWRFSFDRATGDLFIGDVGQNIVEEVDFVPMGTGGGLNLGWPVLEGTMCFNAMTCSLPGATPPVLQYMHDAAGGFAVTGGYVYRGIRSASLRGYYIFGDYGSSRIWAGARDGMAWTKYTLVEPPGVLSGVSAFGEDEAGEIYVASLNTGKLYAIDGPNDPVDGTVPDASVSSSRNPSASGESVTFTAIVSGSMGTPTGSVDFFDGGATIVCASVPLAGGSATCSTAALAAGNHVITVRYPGGPGYNGATSNPVNQAVDAAASEVVAPAPGSALGSTSAAFTWNAGTAVTNRFLAVGTYPGGNDIYGSYESGLTDTVSGLPSNGATLYVRLMSRIADAWQARDYSYTALSGGRSSVVYPVPGSVLTSDAVVFSWTEGAGVTARFLAVGTRPGGNELFGGYVTDQSSQMVTGLPVDGSPVYVRLMSMIGGAWQSFDYTYMGRTAAQAALSNLTTPVAGSVLAPAMMFQWTAGAGVTDRFLSVGTILGGNDIFGGYETGARSQVVTGIPRNGAALYVRLMSLVGGTWRTNDYIYNAADPARSVITSPLPGSTLVGSSTMFVWDAGTNVANRFLAVGTYLGGNDLYGGYVGDRLSQSVSGLPVGRTIYVRLMSQVAGVWRSCDFTYLRE